MTKNEHVIEWHDLIEGYKALDPAIQAYLADQPDELLRHEVYRTLIGTMSFAYINMFLSDVEHPNFRPFLNQTNGALAANPDDSYYITPVDSKGIYRISGFRGSVRFVDVQVGSGTLLTRGTKDQGKTLSNYSLDDLTLGKNGEFEVILSAKKPEGYEGDWWDLAPEAENIIVRQVAYDWVNEVDARMAIERLDTPASMKRQSAQTIQTDLAQIADYAKNWLMIALKFIDNYYVKKGVVNKIESYFIPGGGKSGQLYGGGFFDLEEDEALIYEAKVPGTCEYWNVQLTDELWVSMDWTYHQSSINGFQAQVDDDGVFRAVISQRDPGVPNWLDTVGYSKGSILHRWTGCDEYPEPTARKVKLASLREHLPKDTPSVSHEERERAIRQRTLGVQLRRRW